MTKTQFDRKRRKPRAYLGSAPLSRERNTVTKSIMSPDGLVDSYIVKVAPEVYVNLVDELYDYSQRHESLISLLEKPRPWDNAIDK